MQSTRASPWWLGTPPWWNRPVSTSEGVSRQAEDPSGQSRRQAVLPPEPSSGRGRRHGTSSTEAFDRWFRYPAGFASDYVATLLEQLNLGRGETVVDPFAGSAVIGTAARRSGLAFYGIEAHPLIAELGQLKLQEPPAGGADLVRGGDALIQSVTGWLGTGAPLDLSVETELIRRCFNDETLIQLVRLRQLIRSGEAEVWSLYLKWALLATLRDVASVRVGWPYQRPGSRRQPQHRDILSRFRQRVRWMAADLDSTRVTGAPDGGRGFAGRVVQGDARQGVYWAGLPRGYAYGCVSSPPYLNNFDYADATRLELYFWGEVTTWSQMCDKVRSGMITATTQQSSVGAAEAALAQLQRFQSTSTVIADLTDQLRVERIRRKRGKEYDRVVPDYFVAIGHVLTNLAGALRPGAPAVLLVGDSAPYGIYIDTPKLIAEMSQHVGFSAEKDIILRRRGLRWATNTQRHRTELTERLLLLRRQ
jgi:hypothetical protein